MSLAAPSPPLKELTPRQIQWIGGGYLSMFGSLGGQTIFIALFGSAIRAEFGLTDGQYGLIYTAATLISAICLVFAGTLADKLPAAVLGGGAALGLGVIALIMGMAPDVWVLGFALFGLRFFGQGMLVHNAATAMSRWFFRFRGRALAFSQLGLSTGEAILPVLVALGIAAFGWRSVWMIVAAIAILILAPAIFACFSNPPDGKKAKAQGLANPDAADEVNTGARWRRSRVICDPLFWIVLYGALAAPAISTAIFFHQTSLVEDKGWDLLVFAAFFPVMSVTTVTFSLLAGIIIDRIGANRMLTFALVPMALACLLIWLGDAYWVIPGFFLLCGMSNGMLGTSFNALWAELYGTANLGSIRALATSAMVLSSAVGPGIVGIFIDLGVTLPDQGPAFAAYFLSASALFVVSRGRLARRAREIRENI